MKLKTADIIPFVIKYALTHIDERFDSSDTEEYEEAYEAVSKNKLWKRACKAKVDKMIAIEGLEADYDFGWEYIDILDPTEITKSCIYRHFINDVLQDGLDAIVITDPTDTKIFRICWHCD